MEGESGGIVGGGDEVQRGETRVDRREKGTKSVVVARRISPGRLASCLLRITSEVPACISVCFSLGLLFPLSFLSQQSLLSPLNSTRLFSSFDASFCLSFVAYYLPACLSARTASSVPPLVSLLVRF